MPLPFILAGVAIAAAGYGVKKGVDAKDDLDDAKSYNRRGERLASEFNEKLENQKTNTSEALEKYGLLKKSATDSITEFQTLFDVTSKNSVKNDFNDKKRIVITKDEEIEILKKIGVLDSNLSSAEAVDRINTANIEFSNISEGFQSVAAGSFAGVAAAGGTYLGVGTLATASTGTAISGLSGAAATNATLAWLGGGSLASGGLGMAGGTMVLGGLVAGPLLAIGGSVFAYKAAQAKDEARSRYSKISAQVKEGEIVVSRLNAIEQHTLLCHNTVESLLGNFSELKIHLNQFAADGLHYRDMSESSKQCVVTSYALAYLLSDFIKQGTINDKGDDVSPESIELLESEKTRKYC